MKFPAIEKLRRKLAAEEPAYGIFITLDSASVSEIAAALGLDWIVIDAEHGHLDWKEITEHLRAVERTDTVALVRIAETQPGLVKRALDCGADGVMIPWMESAAQLREAIALARYPPAGKRGIGAERATAWGLRVREHAAQANEHVLVVPIIESVRGGENLEEMLEVPGADLFYFGPADFSSSAGFAGQWEGPGVAAKILELKEKIRRRGKHCGLIATSLENLRERREQGFRMIGFGADAGLLIRSLREALSAAGRGDPLPAGRGDPPSAKAGAARTGGGSRP